MSKAIYAFSGDPITYGHIDIIERAASVFDEVIVGIGVNPEKTYMFSLAERTLMARQSLKHLANIEVTSFSGLLVDFAYEKGASVIVKGVRNPDDFNYEGVLHQVGESQKLGIDTYILFAKPELGHVSSGAVKEIQRNQGFIHEYVTLYVKEQLEERISGQYIVGVTGDMGSGKSYISEMLQPLGSGFDVHIIELDHIGHQILGQLKEPVYQQIRDAIAEEFGRELVDADGFINRKALGEIVFHDLEQLQRLNKMLYTPISVRLRREMAGKKGLILINAALLAETDVLHICNNNILLVRADKQTQKARLMQRNLTAEQIKTRIACQYDYEEKKERIEQIIERDGHGKMWILENSPDATADAVKSLFDEIVEHLGVK